ncbi:MAG TPA: RNA repair domain-containing protein [Candidatus Lokiarchaeia archaeon]|nr:RNA repair domain-containing protein [Candidatus Lokiarchaeia archaeon]
MKTRAVLNRLIWDPKLKTEQNDYVITFIHRGAPGDEKTILFKQITKVLAAYFIYRDESGEDIQIPFHRILTIKNVKRNTCLYVKANHPEEDEFYQDLPPDSFPE